MQITTPLENDQLRSAIARAIGLCAYVDSILNQSAAFDMMAIAVADVDLSVRILRYHRPDDTYAM